MISRAQALQAIEAIAQDARRRIAAGDPCAVDLEIVDRTADGAELDLDSTTAIRWAERKERKKKLAQLWVVMAHIHGGLDAGKKVAQRELWYRLKPLGLFDKPQHVYDRILEVCAVISAWCGAPCPRESLGVIAAPRGSMTGSISLLKPDGAHPLDRTVYQIPGDPEACCSLRVAESRARYIVVVEKDTIFSRLVGDGFLSLVPCVLVTACGFPSLAVRALVQTLVQTLALPCLVLTDYNPHGMALMLTYKFGSESFALDAYCCPELVWAGLHSSDVLRLERGAPPDFYPTLPDSAASHSQATPATLSPSDFQPFTSRDRAVVEGLLRRPAVARDHVLWAEAEAMRADGRKLELEALHALGPDFFAYFLRDKIMAHA